MLNCEPKKISREYDDIHTVLYSGTKQSHLTDNFKVKPCFVCGEPTNLQITACFPHGRPGNMIYQTRPAHKQCVPDKIGTWQFIDGA